MADNPLIDILREGSEAWNRYRKEHPNLRPDFSYAELEGIDLAEADLSKAQFPHANLSKAHLLNANLSYANLTSTKLVGANLVNSILTANLSSADIRNADLTGADLSGANLRETNLYNANLYDANLSGANLSIASLEGANLFSANLRGAILTATELVAADLSSADLTGADVSDANFNFANLTNTNFDVVIGLFTVKGLDTAKGVKTAKGLEGYTRFSPVSKVKVPEINFSQHVHREDIRQQVATKGKIPDSGDVDFGEFTPEAEGNDSAQEEGAAGYKTKDSVIFPEGEVDEVNANEPPHAEDLPTEITPAKAPLVWLTAWSPTAHPDQHFINLEASEEIAGEVPEAALPGDLILFYVTEGTGLLYICSLLEINKKRSQSAKGIKYAKLVIKYRLEDSIPFHTLEADAVLKKWPLVERKMQGAVRKQPQDITSQPEVWTALKKLIIKYNPGSRSFFPGIDEKTVRVKLQESFSPDQRATEDMLGHGTIVKVLASFLKTRETEFPLSIAVDAPWGAGKSTLMYLLQNELQHRDAKISAELKDSGKGEDKYIEYLEDKERKNAAQGAISFTWGALRKTLKSTNAACSPLPAYNSDNKPTKPLMKTREEGKEKRKFETISFNAWRHGTGNRLSASMVSHVINTVAGRLDPIDREKFWFGLNLRRLDIDSLRRKTFFKLFTGSLISILSLIAFIILLLGLPLFYKIFSFEITAKFLFLDSGGTLAALGALGYSVFKNTKKTVSFDLSEHFRSPNYQELMGPQNEIEKDFHHTINYLKVQGKSLAVFVDDLDRCSPNQVVEVVESINLFFGQQCKDCVFIIGMHRDLVATSLELGYEKLVAKVKAAPHLSEELPFGQRFLEKIVQFVVRLPEPGVDDIDRFLDKIVGMKAEMKGASPSNLAIVASEKNSVDEETVTKLGSQKDEARTKADTDATLAVEIANRYSERSEEVKVIFKLVKEALRSNPRQYVRFLNALRFDYYLYVAERPEEPEMEEFLIMAKWVVISLEWPVLANLLLPKRSEFDTILGEKSKAVITRALTRKLVKKLIDVKTGKGKAFLKKMMEVISDERMTKLLDVKLPPK